jgi:hypothetical protein
MRSSIDEAMPNLAMAAVVLIVADSQLLASRCRLVFLVFATHHVKRVIAQELPQRLRP